MEYGCIGRRLSHSYSREIHRELYDEAYELCEMEVAEVAPFLRERAFHAINVTIPYKETVLPHLDEIDTGAMAVGAVNTIVNKNGRLLGYNTDFYGLSRLIERVGISPKGKKVAILGSGGTAKTARAVLSSLGAREILVVSRTPKENQVGYDALLHEHSDIEILMNTTPVGMYPNIGSTPLSLDPFPSLLCVLDAVYHPLRTNLILEARSRGIASEGGLYMLVAQAVRAAELFRDKTYPEEVIERVYRKILSTKESLVLIGMPTSGKSTVGRLLAEALCRPFYDTDELFFERFGTSAAEFIKQNGETAFREKESEICLAVSESVGAVIATGGGVILREENMRALSRDGRVIFLDRPLSALTPADDRPLSTDKEALAARYAEREPLYRAYADLTVDASLTPKQITEIIIDRIQ